MGARAPARAAVRPGEKLGLQALADELGVSRSPVHQALTRLVSEGLVTTTRGQGYRVRPLTSRLMAETHDARAALELYAVEEAIGHLAPRPGRAPPRARADDRPVRDGELVDKLEYLRANEAFHEPIVDLPRNEVISEMYRRLNVHRLVERAYLSLDAVRGRRLVGRAHRDRRGDRGRRRRARAAPPSRANAETGQAPGDRGRSSWRAASCDRAARRDGGDRQGLPGRASRSTASTSSCCRARSTRSRARTARASRR